MERLKLEDLARLVDEQPTPQEQAALDGDPVLRRELESLKAQARALRNLPAILPPPGGWHELEQELVTTGLIRGHAPGAGIWRKWMQVAAAFVLFIGGTAFGWVTAAAPGLDGNPPREAAARPDAGNPTAARAATSPGESASVTPMSLDDARRAVEEAEREWRRASREHLELFHAVNGQQQRRDPVARLAGLEALVAAGEVAVQESPDDEFFNVLYVNALMERQQALHQISLEAWH